MDLLHDSCMWNIDKKLSKYSRIFNDSSLDKRVKLDALVKLKNEIVCQIERMEDDVIVNG